MLLEVLIAMAILGFVAASALSLAADGSSRAQRNHATEAELRDASALMDAVALWSREDLDRHLGRRPQGSWRMEIQREGDALYDVRLEDGTTARLLLQTSFYRPAVRP